MISTAIEYDPFEDITTILTHKESLDNIDDLIRATKTYRLELQNSIEQDNNEVQGDEQITKVSTEDTLKVFNQFDETRSYASTTQSTISRLTEGISHLDNAKRNLSQSLTLFQNLNILVDCYVQSKTLLNHNSYQQMTSTYRVMCSLADNTFAPLKSVDEINKLLSSIARLKIDIYDEILKDYKKAISGKIAENDPLEIELRVGACDLLESDSGSKSKLIDFCLSKLLYEIREIFAIDDEAGSLENLPRRYIFFKKLLNNFNSHFSRYFNTEWEMPLKLTSKFYQMTSRDLQILLKREFHNKDSSSIDLFMTALQETLDFEKYIDVRFSNKVEDTKLSISFEPYLSLWVTHQEKMMNGKILTYLSESKIPENPKDSLVIPSSADLFRTYRSVLTQTLELIGNSANEGILISLATFFTKWLHVYSDKILKPLLLPPNAEIRDKEQTIKYTVLLVNTADYCSTTIDQLEEKLTEFSEDKGRIINVFSQVKNIYGDLLSKGNNLLLNRVLPLDLAFVWKEFNNMDWAHVSVEDYSRYMISLKNTLSFTSSPDDRVKKNSIESIVTQFNREVYSWNFLDKVIDLITHDLLGCIIRLLQPNPPFATPTATRRLSPKIVATIAEQLLLDTELLKQIFHKLLEDTLSDSAQNTASKRVQKHFDANLEKLLKFIKLLMAPLDSPDIYYETYKTLTEDNLNPSVWAFVLALKGVPWDLNIWKQNWSVFDLESEESSVTQANPDFFIFEWNRPLITQFEVNLLRIQDPNWIKLIKNDLKITPQVKTKPSTQLQRAR